MKVNSNFKLKNVNVNLSINTSIIVSNWNLVSRSADILIIGLVDDLIRASNRDLAWSLICDSLYDLFEKSEQERLK